jgi:quinol monooxygenase YgiN
MKTRLLLVLCAAVLMFSCDRQKSAVAPESDTTAVTDMCYQRIIHASVFIKPDKVATFINEAKAMIDSSNLEPGCISYQLYQDPYDATKVIFVEVWQDQAAIDAHFKMPYFLAWGPKSADWLAKPTELKIFNAAQQP